MQVPIINGVYADSASPDFRTSYPRNYVPVPKDTGISGGYLRPADGIEAVGTGPGVDRGGINWNGVVYRVMGSKLCRVDVDGVATTLGDVGSDGRQVTMDYSAERLAIASAGSLFYWDGSALVQVTDVDLGLVLDVMHLAGYFITTDGTHIVVTELTDPTSINPLKYGSAEVDSDPILAVDRLRNEAYALGRYTIEAFQNVGGENFPFQRIDGAQVMKGVIGTHAYTELSDTFYFMGSGRKEAPAVYVMTPGSAQKISTREVDLILGEFTEEQLSGAVMETRVEKHHQHVMLHLPDRCMVFDVTASQALGSPVWFQLDSGVVSRARYRARNLVWAYDRWNVGDPTSPALGVYTSATAAHYGQTVGWEFGVQVLYAEGNDAIVHDMELVALTGRVPLGTDPVVWTSYSHDGETWSLERAVGVGKIGERGKRIAWRHQGRLRNWRVQRFRGSSDAPIAPVRLELQLEPLRLKG